jgi:CRISPR-associated protein Cmr2
MTTDTTWVLLVSLGPVQDFIASARRCQDLWYGSWLLSALSLATARAIANASKDGYEALVFPGGLAKRSLERRAGAEVANKIVAVVRGTEDEVRKLVATARHAMDAERDQLMKDAFDSVGAHDPEARRLFHRDRAEAQVRDLLEFLWVAVPIRDGDYRSARATAERLLSARKNSRRWSQPSWSQSGVPKSSLDGQRESVLDESLYPGPGRPAGLDEARRRRAFGIQGTERLCGVALLKRLGRRPVADDVSGQQTQRRRRFYSTSHLAALPWMLGVQARASDSVRAAWEQLRSTLTALCPDLWDEIESAPYDAKLFGRVDGQLFFENRLIETFEDCGIIDPEVHRRALAALQAFRRVARASEPQPYYAILLADGDRMGRVIDRQDREGHVGISAALVDFARAAERTVQQHCGSLVYSGGDDVLALLPLHTAVDCGAQLAKDFAESLKEWKDQEGHSPTLSAGIAVVHHLAPLDESLAVARRAEKIAKQRRNALTVIVDKRSGDEVVTSGSWDKIVPAIQSAVEWHREGVVAARAAHELAALARLTEGAPPAERSVFRAMAKSEAVRILERKNEAGGKSKVAPNVLEKLKEEILQSDEDNPAAWLGALLMVGSTLARAVNEANPSPQEHTL